MKHIEDDHQTALFRWARLQSKVMPELDLLLHVPNGGKRNAREAARLKAQGTKAGVPDLCLPVPRGGKHGLWIELKAPENGRVSVDQKRWIEALNKQGYVACVCVGWLQARNVIIEYLNPPESAAPGWI